MSRRSLPLKDSLAHVASPLRQTSMLNCSGNDSSVLLQVDLQNVRKELVNRHNDDDAERSELRRSAELQMLQQEVTPTSEKRRSIGSLAELSAAQVAEHYYNCIKLSAENKINAKNAFSLQLIDYMAIMLKRRDPKMDNLQLASYNLDASTKIYAHRVDCVLTDARKMARRLADGEYKIQSERDEGEGRKETKRKEDEDDYCEEKVRPDGVPLPAQLQDVHNAATLDEFAGDNLIAAPPSMEDEDDYCEEKVRPDGVPLPAQLQDVHNAATLDEFAGDNLIAAPPSMKNNYHAHNTRASDLYHHQLIVTINSISYKGVILYKIHKSIKAFSGKMFKKKVKHLLLKHKCYRADDRGEVPRN